MHRYILIILLASVLAHCQQSSTTANKQGEQQNAGQTQASQQPAASAQPTPTLPGVPLELMQKLWNECTHVDYIYYNLPISMSLDEKSSIQYSLRHIAEEAAPLKPECKPAGRVSFQIKGDIALEGDFYFSDGCTYFVFFKNQQKAYANYMTNEAIQYFNNNIQQAMQMHQQKMQGN